jgi:hypothetical protein
MMERFYFKRDHVVGAEPPDPLTPPRLRPVMPNPYGDSLRAARCVAGLLCVRKW